MTDEFFTDIEDIEESDYSEVETIPEDFDFDVPESRVYILVDELGRVTRIEGEYSLPSDLEGWILYDAGYGDKYNLAQSHYLAKPLIAEDGSHNYFYNEEEEEIREATEEEHEEELASFPTQPPTLEERMTDIENQMIDNTEIQAELIEEIIMLELGMTE